MPTRLGQNFLKDKAIVEKIISSANLRTDDFVLEIGPGKGVLTEELIKHAGHVIAVEIDPLLSKLLSKNLSNKKNIEIIKGDILKLNLEKIVARYGLRATEYKIIANIPYYITSPIIRLFLESQLPPEEMVLMVQKEVAERIVAKPGDMSILSVSVQYYAEPEILFTVPRSAFDPAPEVDSAVIKVVCRKQQVASKEETKKFFKIVKAGFAAKRKTLINNLSASLQLDKEIVAEKIKNVGLKPTARAQELSIEVWKKLVRLF